MDFKKTLSIQSFDYLTDLPDDCLALFFTEEIASFDLGLDWFKLLVKNALPPGVKPCYYVLLQDNQVKCVLQLLIGKWSVTGLATFYTSLFRPLLAADLQPAELAVLIRHVMSDTQASTIRFDAMDPMHTSYSIIMTAMRLAGLRPYSFFGFGNWYLPVNGRKFMEYMGSLESQIINTVKRRGKKFIKSGRGRMEIVTTAENMEPALLAWGNIYRASWKKMEPFPEFMPALIRLCAQRGWLRLGLAYYDDQPIAAQIWIVNHGRAAIYKLAYDEAAAEHSAGTLLTAHLMQYVLDVDGVNEVDYLIGDDDYKKNWVSHRRERWGIVGHNPLKLRGLYGCCEQVLGAALQRIRQLNKTIGNSKL